jgi:hypothetical protein
MKWHKIKEWCTTDIASFLWATLSGLVLSAFDLSGHWNLKNISLLDTILSGFFGFVVFQINHNRMLRSDLNRWFKSLRRISEDPYREYDRDTITRFLQLVSHTSVVYSVDRNNPDTWFLNDNYIAFLCLEEALIRNEQLRAYRMFIWKEECFRQSRYQQLLLLNVYAGVNTYIVPLEFLQRKRGDFLGFLTTKNRNIIENLNRQSPYERRWVDMLLSNPDGEEFLLCEQNGTLSGIGKVKIDSVKERNLQPVERECYKFFFEWIQSITDENGNEIFLLNPMRPDPDFPTYWREQIEEKLNKIRGL